MINISYNNGKKPMILANQSSGKKYKLPSIVALLLSVAALGITRALFSPHEPEYRGRGLSSWLGDLAGGEVETQAEAAAAIKQMGPKARPLIASVLRESHAWHKQTSLRKTLQCWANWLRIHARI